MRRLVLATLMVVLALGLWPRGPTVEARVSPSGPPLHVLVAEDSLGPRTLSEFTLSTGIPVEATRWSTAVELLERLRDKAADVDVVFLPDWAVPLARDRGLLRPLDAARLPRSALLDPRIAARPSDPHNGFSLPWSWGTTGLLYRRGVLGPGERTLAAVLGRPELGRVVALRDRRETLGLALRALGHSANSHDAAEVAAARDLLLSRGELRLGSGGAGADEVARGEAEVALIWSDRAVALRRAGHPELAYTVPTDGGLLWVDAVALPAGGSRPEDAHRLLDYLLRPRTAAGVANHRWRATAVAAARPFLDPALLDDPAVYPPEEVLARCEWIQDVGLAAEHFDAAWTLLERRLGGAP